MRDASAAVDYKELVRDDRIHASLYTDPRIFDDEMERIFYRGWVFIGHDSEVPRPGDFVTRSIGTQPIIMVRGQDDTVGVLANRCTHRGTTVIQARHEMHWWVGHTTHALRLVEGVLRMSRKKVVLINAAEPLPNLSFLI